MVLGTQILDILNMRQEFVWTLLETVSNVQSSQLFHLYFICMWMPPLLLGNEFLYYGFMGYEGWAALEIKEQLLFKANHYATPLSPAWLYVHLQYDFIFLGGKKECLRLHLLLRSGKHINWQALIKFKVKIQAGGKHCIHRFTSFLLFVVGIISTAMERIYFMYF
jgi:hypothetical protein